MDALAQSVGFQNIVLQANNVVVTPQEGIWQVNYTNTSGEKISLHSRHVVTTVGAYELKTMLPFVDNADIMPISALHYAPIVQVSVGLTNAQGVENKAFGGLIPTCNNCWAFFSHRLAFRIVVLHRAHSFRSSSVG